MTFLRTPYRRKREPAVVVSRTGPRMVEGIIAAAAAALADGCVEPTERRGLLAFLRQNGLLGVLGRGRTLERFRLATEAPASPDAVAAQMRQLAGMAGASLVAASALFVAAADGAVVPEEFAVLRRLRADLGLAPRGAGAVSSGGGFDRRI